MKQFAMKAKYLVLGFLLASLAWGGLAYAADTLYSVNLFKVRFIINNEETAGSDQPYQYKNGSNYVPLSFVYKGTTYVPLGYISGALKQPIKYFGKQSKIYVGQVPDGEFMSNLLSPVSRESLTVRSGSVKVKDAVFDTGYSLSCAAEKGSASFTLGKKYKKLTGHIGLDPKSAWDATAAIYGDNKLISTFVMYRIDPAKQFEVNVEGVSKLTLEVINSYGKSSIVNFGDLLIK